MIIDLILDLARTHKRHDSINVFIDWFLKMVHFLSCSKNFMLIKSLMKRIDAVKNKAKLTNFMKLMWIEGYNGK